MMHPLSRPFASRYGRPVLERFDPRIFALRYFGECMQCTYCGDACCRFGAEVEVERMNAILEQGEELERYLGVPRDRWFRLDPEDVGLVPDDDYPGGAMTRTGVQPIAPGRIPDSDEACVFLDPAGRGCRLHRYALERGLKFYDLKPMICTIFPVVFEYGALVPGIEFETNEIVCRTDDGPTIYRTAREHLAYYFGPELIIELDARETEFTASDRDFIELPVLT